MSEEVITAMDAEPVMQSPTIGELAKALASAQALIKAPKKGREAKIESQKGAYSYSYADLADVIECYREPLSKNGLALVQPIIQRDGHLVLMTKILHTSGQWIASEFPLKAYDRPTGTGERDHLRPAVHRERTAGDRGRG